MRSWAAADQVVVIVGQDDETENATGRHMNCLFSMVVRSTRTPLSASKGGREKPYRGIYRRKRLDKGRMV